MEKEGWQRGPEPVREVFSNVLVGARGFEPPTSRSQTERTTRLCYAPSCSANACPELRNGPAILASGRSSGQGSEELMCFRQRAATVADSVLDLGR